MNLRKIGQCSILKYICMFLFLNIYQTYAASFRFIVTADMRKYAGSGTYDTSKYFKGVCEAIAKKGATDFMIVPGDLDPPGKMNWTIEHYLGNSYLWYPAVGNHEAETPDDMDWIREFNKNGNSLPNNVNIGPPGSEETTYSFDYENSHFAVINEYYDGSSDTGIDGDVVDELYNWLATDLAATNKTHIFVIGHEPAYPQADADNGRKRHFGDSLDKYPSHRDRFWNLLKNSGVVAYFCGHTHNYSAVDIDGVWQIDVGHARGKGDTGAASTFMVVTVAGDLMQDVQFKAYRDDHNGTYDYNDIIHDLPAALPVELTSFTARQLGNSVVLKWRTESESLNLGFVLQRRMKGIIDWNEIANYNNSRLLMGMGTVSYPTDYQYADNTARSGFDYEYQLADVSLDGNVEYLSTVSISMNEGDNVSSPETAFLAAGYPNPFRQETIINYMINRESNTSLTIVNLLGKTIKQLVGEQLQPVNNYSVIWDGTDQLGNRVPGGVYFAILKTGLSIQSKKLLLLR